MKLSRKLPLFHPCSVKRRINTFSSSVTRIGNRDILKMNVLRLPVFNEYLGENQKC